MNTKQIEIKKMKRNKTIKEEEKSGEQGGRVGNV